MGGWWMKADGNINSEFITIYIILFHV